MSEHTVVSPADWLAARQQLLAQEKEFTRLRDQLSQARRDLPWEAVTKPYVFEGPDGPRTLAEMFDGRSQLVVYHFMFDPEWDDGCLHCSFWADNFNDNIVHLNHRDVTLVAVSHAPYPKLAAYEQRMGWSFKWFSAFANDFNFDYHVSFTPAQVAAHAIVYNYAPQDMEDTEREGVSVFYKDADGQIFHTYSAYARGIDMLNAAYHYLDLVPKGRDEADGPQAWLRRHNEYSD